jgi:hypothetical protein
MNIITNRKVITTNDINEYSNACGCSGFDSYSNADDNTPKLPDSVSITNPQGQKKAGMLWDKAKGTWVKSSDWLNAHPQFKSILANYGTNILQNAFGGIFAGLIPTNTPQSTIVPPTETIVIKDKEKEKTPKMSNGVKIAIVVGIASLLGFLIYKSTKK